jgi:hypothetical protein
MISKGTLTFIFVKGRLPFVCNECVIRETIAGMRDAIRGGRLERVLATHAAALARLVADPIVIAGAVSIEVREKRRARRLSALAEAMQRDEEKDHV